jgi:hypothetical protein
VCKGCARERAHTSWRLDTAKRQGHSDATSRQPHRDLHPRRQNTRHLLPTTDLLHITTCATCDWAPCEQPRNLHRRRRFTAGSATIRERHVLQFKRVESMPNRLACKWNMWGQLGPTRALLPALHDRTAHWYGTPCSTGCALALREVEVLVVELRELVRRNDLLIRVPAAMQNLLRSNRSRLVGKLEVHKAARRTVNMHVKDCPVL